MTSLCIPPVKRLPIVGVMGSGSHEHREMAEPLGRWLAAENVHLLTGGGSGVMTSVSRAFYNTSKRNGLILGIIPGIVEQTGYEPKAGYPNPWVEIPIFTHLPLSGTMGTDPMSRNHINILSSDVLIALPGSSGTASEVSLALQYSRPLVAFLKNRKQIPGLPEGTHIENDLEKVKAFIRQHTGASMTGR